MLLEPTMQCNLREMISFGRNRYIKGMKWEDVADEMAYSWRKIHYLHNEALEHFRFKVPEILIKGLEVADKTINTESEV